MKILDKLDGYKTYLFVALIILIEVLEVAGYLDSAVANSLEIFMGAGGLAGLRHAVKKG
jgi:hypothetical protein